MEQRGHYQMHVEPREDPCEHEVESDEEAAEEAEGGAGPEVLRQRERQQPFDLLAEAEEAMHEEEER